MSSQTTISIDKETKKIAEMLAKTQGLSLSAVAKILFRDYAKGKIEIGTKVVNRDENGFTPEKERQLEQVLAEIEEERNLSPRFKNGKDAIKWLKNGN